MDDTIRSIIDASALPISIVIVGIGDSSFDVMKVLDADFDPLKIDGRVAERDIVQFVRMKQLSDFKPKAPEAVMARLAQEVLAELPGQLVSYYENKK
jgi:hypothetical protein